ncbi:uncharacterized protein J3D65DRAFT_365805 [Phyllosticta citribraziliensis]|uniref:Uncharacterized protein n=1 Tax=Phyllosticta citribraziliensis TaxID=989973 RepID=A0ABR1LPL3_9PEZI
MRGFTLQRVIPSQSHWYGTSSKTTHRFGSFPRNFPSIRCLPILGLEYALWYHRDAGAFLWIHRTRHSLYKAPPFIASAPEHPRKAGSDSLAGQKYPCMCIPEIAVGGGRRPRRHSSLQTARVPRPKGEIEVALWQFLRGMRTIISRFPILGHVPAQSTIISLQLDVGLDYCHPREPQCHTFLALSFRSAWGHTRTHRDSRRQNVLIWQGEAHQLWWWKKGHATWCSTPHSSLAVRLEGCSSEYCLLIFSGDGIQ